MSGGHTLGPWSANETEGGEWEVIQPDATTPEDPWYIALVCDNANGGDTEANARLIAAAPDGLEFAEAHHAYMLGAGYSGPDDKALHPNAAENWRRCLAYIAKATGK